MSSFGASTATRPAAPKRNSSSGVVSKGTIRSPGSDLDIQPLRHQVRPKGHARVVLPRNHSSGRNLAKLARQVAAAEEAQSSKTHGRHRSHEGDTEIRLPGSLDESEMRSPPPPIRRNYTASNLPRNSSHTKLKKNLSHGHLQRLGTTRDLTPLTSSTKSKVPLSPGLKGKSKRPRSMDWDMEKDLHTREVELAMQRQESVKSPRKVGFAVGSVGDNDTNPLPNMEGSGLDEGEWTEESASVSPHSTRQNTASNSRRESVHQERPAAPEPPVSSQETSSSETETETEVPMKNRLSKSDEAALEADGTPAESYMENSQNPQRASAQRDSTDQIAQQPTIHANPAAHLLRRQSGQIPAPALISNVNVMDDTHSMRTSPAASLRSTRSNMVGIASAEGSQDPDELVSRFVPSTSNGSGTTATMQNTPKSGSFHNADEAPFGRHRDRNPFSLGPVSPGSTISGSSGATTPAHGRSRIELKMLQEKALADMEVAAERGPLVPAHVYDRRNESLKSYLQLATLSNAGRLPSSSIPLSLGPEIFQGRFKAVNTELKVVQMFRDPIVDSLSRLRARQANKGSLRQVNQKKETSSLRMTKSAVTLPVRTAQKREPSMLSTSTSPSKDDLSTAPSSTTKPVLTAAKSSLVIKSGRRAPIRGVSFAGADERKEIERENDEISIGDIAKEMWDSVLA